MPFNAPVNEAGIFGEKNKLVVVVNNELSNTTLPCGHTETKPSGKKYIKPSFDFFNYAGLNRPVKITVTNREYIYDIDILSDINGSDGIVNYEVHTTGENKVFVKIYDEEGKEVASTEGKSGKIVIKNAKLWNPKAAYLYKFEACIKNGEELIDEYYLDFGIRTIKVEGTKFLINGKPFYFTGFGKHEDSETAGRGYNPPVIKRDFELIKWIGANSFRTSHYPYSEEIMQAADREGIPSVSIPKADLDNGMGILELYTRSGLTASNGDARRLVTQGGAEVNGNKITDPKMVLSTADLDEHGEFLLKAGKKRYMRVIPE